MREDLIASLRKMIVNDLYVEIAENDIGLDDGLRTVVGLDSVGFVELRALASRDSTSRLTITTIRPRIFRRSGCWPI